MPELTIPEEYEYGIAKIKNLSDADVGKILKVLNDESPGTSPFEISKKLQPNVPEEDVAELVKALCSLYSIRAYADATVAEFVDALVRAISKSKNKELRTSEPEELQRLKRRFESLLTVRSLSIASKANVLRTDCANIFWDAKIIADIRPIWDSDVKQPPDATVITNTMKLEYHHIGGHGEFYVCLDKDDIEKLMTVLKRAQDKIATLQTLATAQWMKILEE